MADPKEANGNASNTNRRNASQEDLIEIDHSETTNNKCEEKRGLIYVGHIPRDCHQKQVKNYFKGFGKIINIKVCKSKVGRYRTGYGFIEFDDPEKAKVAADTMNHYMIANKKIVTEYIPDDQRPKGLFTKRRRRNLESAPVKMRGAKKNKGSAIQIQGSKTGQKKANKIQSKRETLRSWGIQCSLIQKNTNDKSIEEIKLEKNSVMNVSSQESKLLNSNVTFKKSNSYQISTKNAKSRSNNSSNKSLNGIKSNKAMLTKSLDSVKNLLSKYSTNSQDEGTQTPRLRVPKKGRNSKKNIRKGRLVKVKQENIASRLNSNAVKTIARELIRRRGNPLITLKKGTP